MDAVTVIGCVLATPGVTAIGCAVMTTPGVTAIGCGVTATPGVEHTPRTDARVFAFTFERGKAVEGLVLLLVLVRV